jgi:hypothetical protein
MVSLFPTPGGYHHGPCCPWQSRSALIVVSRPRVAIAVRTTLSLRVAVLRAFAVAAMHACRACVAEWDATLAAHCHHIAA